MTTTTSMVPTPHPPEGGEGNLLSVRNLNVYYGESHILRNVDLSIAPGEMVCLIGLNGVGKTTMLKTIIGLLRQRSGSLKLDGNELSALPPPSTGSLRHRLRAPGQGDHPPAHRSRESDAGPGSASGRPDQEPSH